MDRAIWRQIVTPAVYIFLIGVIAIFAHSGLQSDHGLAAFHEAGDEERRLTLHHIPDNPHAEDLTLSVIDTADQRFVYISDLYNAGFGMTLVLGGPEAFYANMRSLGLIDEACAAPVPTTIVPGHGVPLPLEDSIAELAAQGIDIGCP